MTKTTSREVFKTIRIQNETAGERTLILWWLKKKQKKNPRFDCKIFA